MGICVFEIQEDGRLRDWLAVRNELEPDDPLPFEHLSAVRASEPERRELIATVNGEIAGIGSVGPKGSPPELAYGYIGVRDAWKQRGAETALLARVREIAQELGRSRIVLQPVAARPEFGAGAYEVAAQTWRNIPGETGIQERDAWLSLHVERAAGGAVVAVHGGEVVGFAGLNPLAGEGLYEHGLLAVLPGYRRRGIARAMKTAQLEWLKDRGARRVVTWNSEANHAARVLNLSLGHTPLPSSIAFQGPV